MSFRLCIVGNSHAAAYATGWPQVAAQFPDVEITFFAARAKRLAELIVRGNALRARSPSMARELERTSGGRSEIAPQDYDAIWIVGLGIGIEPAIAAYRSFWSEAHRPDPLRAPISDPAFVASIDAALEGSLAVWIVGHLGRLAKVPMQFIAQPNPSADLLDSADERTEPFRLAIDQEDEHVLWQQYRDGLARLGQRTGVGISEQPDDMRVHAVLTSDRWSRGSVRLTADLTKEHERDYVHMNADYGAAMFALHLPATIEPARVAVPA